MAVPRKLVVVPNPATRDLWRFVESGEIDKFEAVLPRAEINARNEHGMTALMRAARQGRTRMVCALLEHGADPNVVRSDNFTALSLAAFFGHTEIVEVLLKHGARTDVATRYGTSPHMWAKARSFKEVVQCLEKRGEAGKPAPLVSVAPAPAPPVQVEVRTLKDPPEIWDLVHEAPRQFNAGSVFFTRIRSVKARVLVPAIVSLVVLGGGLTAISLWKSAVPPSPISTADTPSQPIVSRPLADAPAPVPTTSSVVTPANNSDRMSAPVTTVDAPVNVTRRSRVVARSRSTEVNLPGVNTIETPTEPAPPVIAPKPESRTESTTKNRAAAPLSSQMISPPKSSQPKAKVIQWP
jgi:hypothetical protein